MQNIYNTILVINHIKVKDTILENILPKIAITHRDNFNIIEKFLYMTGSQLTHKIYEKILNEYSKANDVFSAFILVKLLNEVSPNINLNSVDINQILLKKIIYFLIDNTHLTFNDNFFTRLSKENQEFYDKIIK